MMACFVSSKCFLQWFHEEKVIKQLGFLQKNFGSTGVGEGDGGEIAGLERFGMASFGVGVGVGVEVTVEVFSVRFRIFF